VAVTAYPELIVIGPADVKSTDDPLMSNVQSHDWAVAVLSDPPDVTPTAPVALM
jgi:hypothetical protein